MSMICSILKNKYKIKKNNASKVVTRITTQQPRIVDDVEKLLLIWINEKQLQNNTINENIICEKVKLICADVIKKTPASSLNEEEAFKVSRGWFEEFKTTTGIHSIVRHGEAASSDLKAAENFVDIFKMPVNYEGYLSLQVFNCDKMGLFWKKMPKQTYITAEQMALPDHKSMKDHLTLFFGDLKFKALLVYHLDNPRAFKKYVVQKSMLMWRFKTRLG